MWPVHQLPCQRLAVSGPRGLRTVKQLALTPRDPPQPGAPHTRQGWQGSWPSPNAPHPAAPGPCSCGFLVTRTHPLPHPTHMSPAQALFPLPQDTPTLQGNKENALPFLQKPSTRDTQSSALSLKHKNSYRRAPISWHRPERTFPYN